MRNKLEVKIIRNTSEKNKNKKKLEESESYFTPSFTPYVTTSTTIASHRTTFLSKSSSNTMHHLQLLLFLYILVETITYQKIKTLHQMITTLNNSANLNDVACFLENILQ